MLMSGVALEGYSFPKFTAVVYSYIYSDVQIIC